MNIHFLLQNILTNINPKTENKIDIKKLTKIYESRQYRYIIMGVHQELHMQGVQLAFYVKW